jgi:hypothetical protein
VFSVARAGNGLFFMPTVAIVFIVDLRSLTIVLTHKNGLLLGTISEDRRVQGNEKTHYHQKN